MDINNLQEYEDALLYDAEYGHYTKDYDLFLNLKSQGAVLDLACGTGRLTIPFAQNGFWVIGLDASQSMLDLARQKTSDLPIQWVQGDVRAFHFDQKFDLIVMAGNAFQALLTKEDQLQMLKCVKEHLKPEGTFAFNTRNPSESELKTTEDFEWWHDFQDATGETVQVFGKQNYDALENIVTYTTKRIWPNHETLCKIQLRFTSYRELASLLEGAGFLITQVYGDFEKQLFAKDSPSIVVVCQLK
jgi:ubiquinone/menaquinone biosynthesis C-methylase UbiE